MVKDKGKGQNGQACILYKGNSHPFTPIPSFSLGLLRRVSGRAANNIP
jgi:hypothetical protein